MLTKSVKTRNAKGIPRKKIWKPRPSPGPATAQTGLARRETLERARWWGSGLAGCLGYGAKARATMGLSPRTMSSFTFFPDLGWGKDGNLEKRRR